MPNNPSPSYFHSRETMDFSFFRIPRALVKDERFRDLSTDAKLLYGLMLDRMGLSLQNDWQDAEGRTFIYFTLEEIQATLSCGHNKAVRLIAELEQYDLIERVKQGQGKPAKIYVKKIDANDADEQTPKPADLQASEKPTCRLPASKRLDFPQGDGNYTIAIFKKANNKQKRQTNAGNPAAKQNRVPCEPRQGAGPDFGLSIHEGGPSSWTTSSQWDSDRDCRAEGIVPSFPFPPGPPGRPLHGESAYCPSQQCLRA